MLQALAAYGLIWWMGDVFGIIVFLPRVLLAPWNSQPLQWRGTAVASCRRLAR